MNLGFGVANNRAIEAAQGRYLVLLNSDAFFHSGALARAIAHMEADPSAGVGGARLVGRDGAWQPAARMFPTILRDAFVLRGSPRAFPVPVSSAPQNAPGPILLCRPKSTGSLAPS